MKSGCRKRTYSSDAYSSSRPGAEMFRLMFISLAAHLGLLETHKESKQFPCTLTHIHAIDDHLVLGVDDVALDLKGRRELTAFDAQHVW